MSKMFILIVFHDSSVIESYAEKMKNSMKWVRKMMIMIVCLCFSSIYPLMKTEGKLHYIRFTRWHNQLIMLYWDQLPFL